LTGFLIRRNVNGIKQRENEMKIKLPSIKKALLNKLAKINLSQYMPELVKEALEEITPVQFIFMVIGAVATALSFFILLILLGSL
jgi:hypothetical protein